MSRSWHDSTIEGIITNCDYGLSCGLSTDSSGVPILRMGNLQGGRVSLADLKYAPKEKVGKQHLLRSGDLLLNRTNSLDLVGKVGLFTASETITFASYLFRLRTDPAKAVPEWLVQVLHSASYQAMLRDIATPGVSQANINRDRLRAIPIPVPPLDEQKKIAAILESVDEVVHDTRAVINQLEVVKKSMMTELLTRGLPGQHTRFKRTEIGEVPDRWTITTVGSLGEFSGGNGFRPPDWSTTGLPIIRIQNLNGSLNFNYYSREPDPAWLVEPEDLLFAWAGTRGASFGPCLWPGPRGVLNQHIHRIVPRAHVRKVFLYYVLRLLTEAVEKKAHGFKETLVHLRKAELTEWVVALPPLDEQDGIVAVLGSLEDRFRAEQQSLQALTTVKRVLSGVLLTGEVRVKPDEEAA